MTFNISLFIHTNSQQTPGRRTDRLQDSFKVGLSSTESAEASFSISGCLLQEKLSPSLNRPRNDEEEEDDKRG